MIIKSRVTFKKARIKHGYSITALAKAMSVSPATVLYIEQGKNIHPRTAKKACEVLDAEFDDLFVIEDWNSKTAKR